MANSIRQASMAKDGSNQSPEDAYGGGDRAGAVVAVPALAVVFGGAWFVVLVGLVAPGARPC